MKPNLRSAFTLVEVLVVIAITSLLAGLILSYSSASRDRVALYVEQAKLAQTIVKAKSLTVSTYNDPVIPCGYGVHIDYAESSYQIFSYGVEEGSNEAAKCDDISELKPELMIQTESNKLPPNLQFRDPETPSQEYDEDIRDILFLPPNPETRIWLYRDNGATSTAGRVQLTTKSGAFSVDVLVSSAGQVTF